MSANSLAQWFMAPDDLSGVGAAEMLREEQVGLAYQFTEFGVNGRSVIMRVPGGRMLVEVDQHNADLIWFTFAPSDQFLLYRFWFNRSSVKDLGDLLRSAPEKRRSFDSIFLN